MLIEGDAVVTINPARRVLAPGWVQVERSDIVAVGAGPPPATAGPVAHRAGVVLPGLVSAHQHLLDVVARGTWRGDDFPTWLLDRFGAAVAALGPEDCATATAAALAGTVAGGVTTVVDCWGLDVGARSRAGVDEAADACLEVHRASGARVLFARMFAETAPPAWHRRSGFPVAAVLAPADAALDQVAGLAARHHGSADGRIRVAPSPELPEAVSPAAFRAARDLAAELGTPLPLHLCASPASRAACGPGELDAMGVLDAGLLAAHCTAVDDADIAALAGAGVAVAHCPTSNLALRGAVTPVAAFRRAGAPVGLGLDNGSLNPRLDLLGEARAAIAASIARGDPLAPSDVLAMATIEGARAVGLADVTGSIEVGKRADLVLLDTGGDHWWPHADIVDAVVEQSRPTDVRLVMVDGAVVAVDGVAVHVPVDRPALVALAARVRATLP
ncbi:amidohydrolase family protein [Iamia sp. SCSIO 61187]|uniref:amidohydrolase family protein n=1 Tax=Iamia sp. SCSIO 61187 TaxID=2722752 RepID=UPI001C632010|nr:amidohydrolase family protein [Iamia sp. SCSIO 61187]QYG93147.1 amidohydrolase family protein [Iamia sp. SCSIO 61187]